GVMLLMISPIKKEVVKLIRGSVPVTNMIGCKILSNRITRPIFNYIYDNASHRTCYWLVVLFDKSRIPKDFLWQVSFLGRTILIPVLSGIQRSWNNALILKFMNRGILRFYEFCVKHYSDGVFCDIGAGDGMDTYPFAIHGFTCISFEPQPTCTEYVRRSMMVNGFTNIKVEECALSDFVGEADLFLSDSTWYSSFSEEFVEKAQGSPPKRARIACNTLDRYCSANKIRPDIVKVDVEGHEWHVIRGGRQTILDYRPAMVIESQPYPVLNRENIWRFFNSVGYRLYNTAFCRIKNEQDFIADVDTNFIVLHGGYLCRLFEESYCQFKR
ncbi:MAG: FkbM family methyltransferase, partial [Dehalococcoidia bacterium]|nr:FkbM family methyltransferase [Dehalococcoidia bacterium]